MARAENNAWSFSHRDAEAGTEAALLLFVPLDETSAPMDGDDADNDNVALAGPPELCPCTHWPGSPEECQSESAPLPMVRVS